MERTIHKCVMIINVQLIRACLLSVKDLSIITRPMNAKILGKNSLNFVENSSPLYKVNTPSRYVGMKKYKALLRVRKFILFPAHFNGFQNVRYMNESRLNSFTHNVYKE